MAPPSRVFCISEGQIFLWGFFGGIYRRVGTYILCIFMRKPMHLVYTVFGMIGIITVYIFMHKITHLVVVVRRVAKICERFKKYGTRILPWVIKKQNVFIFEGHRNGNQRVVNNTTSPSRNNISGAPTEPDTYKEKLGHKEPARMGNKHMPITLPVNPHALQR